ncbi:MAG: amidohydrolase family protein [Planctomycetota bacterium]|jgi:imidazolonepropionase-like amidohydrolase
MLLLPILSLCCTAAPLQEPSSISVDRLHVGDGTVIENALIVLEDGKVVSIVPGGSAAGALHIEGAHATPGLVDAFSFMGVGGATMEESRESTPSIRLSQTANLDAASFGHALQEGVTSAYLSPDSLNVIGGLGAFVKTGGGLSANLFAERGSAARLVDSQAALKVTLGNDASMGNFTPRGGRTSSFNARRPNTRMGTVWVVRREFYRAKDYLKARQGGLPVYDADLEVLAAVLEGKIPLRVQARRSHDVQTALRLQKEFGWPNLIIEEATEGHEAATDLVAAGVSVATAPAYDSLSRAIARGPSAAELKLLAHPPAICCEDLHDVEGLHSGDEENGLVELSGTALDLLVALAPRYGAASGLNNGRFSEGRGSTPALAALLDAAGVSMALGSAEAHDQALTESSLIHQARNAVRWGMEPAAALQAVTSKAAELCGTADQVGKVEVGFDADLVLWSGDPLDGASRPILVILDGRIAVDNRPQE